jgi:hypothetical protein
MLKYPLELLLILIVCGICFFIYRKLVASPTFNHLVDETLDPPADPDTDDAALRAVDRSLRVVGSRAERAEQAAREREQAAAKLRRKLND